MKYEVTGDTIIIKYIADGKYKQLELNKNDNIDLDFFGQLIKAKNNKQDAMCDLYAKEVLSYDPAPERITNMSLTKVEEPSEYTKKEAAKLRIEELNRDLKLVTKEIENTLAPVYKHKKPEELKDIELTNDYLSDKNDDVNKLKDLLSKYNSIKKMIEKEQKTYDDNTKNNLSQDQLINKITKEFETKLNKVVDTSDEQKKAIELFKNTLKPNESINYELEKNFNLIEDLKELIIKYKAETEISEREPIKDSIVKNLKLLSEYINLIYNLLKTTNINNDISERLYPYKEKFSNRDYREEIDEYIEELKDILDLIKEENDNDKINYTKATHEKIVKATNKLLSENNRLQWLYEQTLSPKFVDDFINAIPDNLILGFRSKKSCAIKTSNITELNDIVLQDVLDGTDIILLWYDPEDEYIYSNQKIFSNFELDKEAEINLKNNTLTYQCYKISKANFQNQKYYIFRNYITTNKTEFKLPLNSIDLYLNLESFVDSNEINYNGTNYKIEYNGYDLKQTSISSLIDIISGSGQGEGINSKSNKEMYSGKIDLDKASTEDKLSEIVRLLQNIGYNLFTLTPNYEESEKNKQLKSKGVDLQEYFKTKSD